MSRPAGPGPGPRPGGNLLLLDRLREAQDSGQSVNIFLKYGLEVVGTVTARNNSQIVLTTASGRCWQFYDSQIVAIGWNA